MPGTAVPMTMEALPKLPRAAWLVLEAVEGTVPDIRAAALVCRALRRALMSGYRSIGRADRIPKLVSGQTPSVAPTCAPHVAIVPMAFVGFPHADGRVVGFALVPRAAPNLPAIPGLALPSRRLRRMIGATNGVCSSCRVRRCTRHLRQPLFDQEQQDICGVLENWTGV